MELFVFCHARESGSPAGTGQNASGGRKGFKVSSRSVDSQSVQTNVFWGRTQHRSKATRGPRTLPFTCQLQRPRARRHVSQVAPRAAPAPVLRLMGKGAVGPLPPQQPKGKGKRRTGHLPGKGGSQVLIYSIAAPSSSPSPRP